MSFTVPPRGLFQRWNAIACAIVIFAWTTPEEDRPVFSALLGVWLAVSVLAWWATGRFAGVTLGGWRLTGAFAFVGACTGAASSLFSVLLMVFKDARHAHPFPDYPPALLGAMLARLPAWTLAGLLIGVGAALVLAARTRRLPDTASPQPPHML